MTLFLTDPFIRSLRPAEAGRTQYFDTNVKGLCLRVSETNRKTWCVVYRFNGRVRRYTLGVYPLIGLADARQRATYALREVSGATDPSAVKIQTRQAETFNDLETGVTAVYDRHSYDREMRAALDYLGESAPTDCQFGAAREAHGVRRTLKAMPVLAYNE